MNIYISCIEKQYNSHPRKLSETVLQNTTVHDIFIFFWSRHHVVFIIEYALNFFSRLLNASSHDEIYAF